MMKKIFAILALVATVFASCGKDDDNDNNKLAQQLLGRWMDAEHDGLPVVTNEKWVVTFTSDTSAIVSTSRADFTEEQEMWDAYRACSVVTDGDKVTLAYEPNKRVRVVFEYDVESITDSEFSAHSVQTIYIDNEVYADREMDVRYIKVPIDYRQEIIGMWEGRVTSEGSDHDDGELHRWEYRADGTYGYYDQVDGQWQLHENVFNEYFVDGVLLCTRWRDPDSDELREWWEIDTIANGQMNWTALRHRDDGSSYTATFSMNKVQ